MAGSDHWLVFLLMELEGALSHPDFMSKIQEWWLDSAHIEGSVMYRFQQRLKHLKFNLKQWNKTEFGNIFEEKQMLENRLNATQMQAIQSGYIDELKTREKDTQ